MNEKWLNEYDGLVNFKKDKLYCITGPFILGIELIKLPRIQKYRPHLVLYSLYGLPTGYSLKECMSYPVLMLELFNINDMQISLDFDQEITEAKNSLNDFLAFKIGCDISIYSFLDWLDEIVHNINLKSRIKLPEVWEVRYNLALYYSDEKANKVLNEIKISADKLDKLKCFKNYGGWNLWLKELVGRSRTEHLKIICENKNRKELKNLQRFDFI